jgi:hypothetical protein
MNARRCDASNSIGPCPLTTYSRPGKCSASTALHACLACSLKLSVMGETEYTATVYLLDGCNSRFINSCLITLHSHLRKARSLSPNKTGLFVRCYHLLLLKQSLVPNSGALCSKCNDSPCPEEVIHRHTPTPSTVPVDKSLPVPEQGRDFFWNNRPAITVPARRESLPL